MYLDSNSSDRLVNWILAGAATLAVLALICAALLTGGCGGQGEDGIDQGAGGGSAPASDSEDSGSGGYCYVADAVWLGLYFGCAERVDELGERVRRLEEQLAVAEDALRDCEDGKDDARCKRGKRWGWWRNKHCVK